MNTCDACGKPFKGESSLLSHISHKADCKEFYGDEKLKIMRRDAKLLSKRKYNNTESMKKKQSDRYQAQKEKRKLSNKEKYAKRNSSEGKIFSQFFDLIYIDYENDLKTNILLDRATEVVHESAYEKAMDFAMDFDMENIDYNERTDESADWARQYCMLVEKKCKKSKMFHYQFTDDIVSELIEEAMESSFNFHFKRLLPEFRDCVIKGIRQDFWYNSKQKAKNQCFKDFYEVFCKEMYSEVESKVIDKSFEIFLNQFDEEDKEDKTFASADWAMEVEYSLDRTYREVLREELHNESKTSDLALKMRKVVKDVLSERTRLTFIELKRIWG